MRPFPQKLSCSWSFLQRKFQSLDQTSHWSDLFVHFLNTWSISLLCSFLLVCPQSAKWENPVLRRDVNQQKNLSNSDQKVVKITVRPLLLRVYPVSTLENHSFQKRTNTKCVKKVLLYRLLISLCYLSNESASFGKAKGTSNISCLGLYGRKIRIFGPNRLIFRILAPIGPAEFWAGRPGRSSKMKIGRFSRFLFERLRRAQGITQKKLEQNRYARTDFTGKKPTQIGPNRPRAKMGIFGSNVWSRVSF